MTARKMIMALAILPLIAACSGGTGGTGGGTGGGSGGSTAASNQYNRYLNENRSLQAEFPAGGQTTSWAQMPRSGTAVYDGVATLRVGTSDRLSLLGDANIGVNFANRTVSGTVDNFVGRRDNVANAQNWDGRVRLNGDYTSTTTPLITTDMNGTLTQGGNRLNVDGLLQGRFYNDGSDRAEGLRLDTRNGSVFTLNGRQYTSGSNTGLSIVGER